jgi:hypothetical protein
MHLNAKSSEQSRDVAASISLARQLVAIRCAGHPTGSWMEVAKLMGLATSKIASVSSGFLRFLDGCQAAALATKRWVREASRALNRKAGRQR